MSYTLIFLESPYRVVESLEDLLSILGDRRICVAREMTKMFEEYWRGSVSEALEYFKSQPARGEFTFVIEGKRTEDGGQWTVEELQAAINKGLAEGEAPSDLAGRLAKESGWKRREVYKRIAS